MYLFFFFKDTSTTETYTYVHTLSLHDALPIYGGSCFPKDTKAFVRMGESFGTPQRIVAAVVKSNARRKRNLVHRVRRACGGNLAGKRIADRKSTRLNSSH